MKVRFLAAARADVRDARNWYEERSPVAAAAFAQRVADAINQIAESPDRFPRGGTDTRRYVLTRFPFTIVYRVAQREVLILAVAHHRRHPGYWHDRTER